MEMQKFCKSRGIDHQFTAPYNPEQNGKAERDIRTVTEIIRAMIFGRNLLKKLWSETVGMAAYILNRSTTSKCNKTPYERWFGRKPNILDIKTFGSTAYAHVPDVQRQKLDPKANKLTFVGYQGNSENCRLINLSTFKITVTASVTFIEGKGDFNFQKSVGVERELMDDSEDTDDEEWQTQQREPQEKMETSQEENENEEVTEENKIQRNLRDRFSLKQPNRWTYSQPNLTETDPRNYEVFAKYSMYRAPA